MEQLIYAITFTETILVVSRLTDEARDVWLIEITGGLGQDCEGCVNYNFTNMTQFYVPALLSGVENYSDQHALQYVGFSNGCRAALSSLDLYDASGKVNAGYYFDQNTGTYKAMNMSANLVREFIGVGCPGNFTGDSPLKYLMEGELGDITIKGLESNGETHASIEEIAYEACSHPGYIKQGASCAIAYLGGVTDDISLNSFRDYYVFMNSTTDKQPGKDVSVNRLTILQGTFSVSPGESDLVVTNFDAISIANTITSADKEFCYIRGAPHAEMAGIVSVADKDTTKELIKIRLKGESIPWYYLCGLS